jgi:hypothetical protein
VRGSVISNVWKQQPHRGTLKIVSRGYSISESE